MGIPDEEKQRYCPAALRRNIPQSVLGRSSALPIFDCFFSLDIFILKNAFTQFIIQNHAEEDGLNYRVISIEERPPSSRIWRGKWKNRIVPKDDIDRLQGAFLYEMFCTENDPLLLLRELFLMYKNYYNETKEKLAEIENHMKIIANEALKPI